MTEPRNRRNFIGGAAALGLAMLLAGCQVVPGGRPGRPQPQPDVETPSAPHNIAVLVPLSGSNAGVGRSISNAAMLALEDSKSERIKINVYDTAKAGGAAAAANQALADGSQLFLGPLLAEDVTAVASVAGRANVPVIAFSNDTSVVGNGVYLLGFDPDQSVDRVVRFARERGMTRFAGLIPGGAYGRRASGALTDSVAEAKGQLVGLQAYDRAPRALQSAVNRLNAGPAYDAVLIGDNGANASRGIAAIPARARILGTELWKTQPNLGATARMRGAWYAAVNDAMFDELKTRYRAKYGASPYRLASLGYDGVLLVLRVARNWREGQPFPTRGLLDSGGFAGIDGAFRFGRSGIAERMLEVVEITAGGQTVVSPAPRSFGD